MRAEHISSLHVLKGTPHDILFAFIRDPEPKGSKELAYVTHHTEAQIANSLRLLHDLGMIQRVARYNGWMLTPLAEKEMRLQPVSAPAPAAPNLQEAATAGTEAETGTHFLSVPPLKEEEDLILISKDLTSSSSLSDSEARTGEKNRPKGRKNGRSSPRARSGKGRMRHPPREAPIPAVPRPGTAPASLPATNAGPASAPAGLAAAPAAIAPPGEAAAGPEPAFEAPDPAETGAFAELSLPEISVRRLLAATEDLFGEPVLGWAEEYPDPHRLLAWIAQAYGQRRTLNTPARMVYRRMHEDEGRQADKKYQEDPCAFLPASFLRATGLPVPPEAEDAEPEEDWPEEAVEDAPPDASLSFPVRYTYLEAPPGLPGPTHVTRTSACAWATAMDALRSSLDRYSFQRFTAGLRLRRYEPEACRFVATAPDEAQRALAEDRLAALLCNILRGICNGNVEVGFEVEG